jgi:hypothetical protein
MDLLMDMRSTARRIVRSYSSGDNRPLSGYLAALGAYGAVVAGVGGLVKARGRRLPDRVPAGDVILLGIATHKISRILTKEAVTSPLRAPFTRYEQPAGDAELAESVRANGSHSHAVGELMTCPFCMAVWVATSLTAGLVLAPRFTRLAATVFTSVAASDFLQMAYAAAKKAAE